MTFVRVTEQTLDFLVDIEADQGLWPYAGEISSDKEEHRERHRKFIGSDSDYDFLVYDKAFEAPIGVAYISCKSKLRREWEIGYIILPPHQRMGYGFQAAGRLLQFGFEDLNAHRIFATCNAHNIASSRILQKLGMRQEAVHIEKLYWNGRWTDQLFYAILDREFFDKAN